MTRDEEGYVHASGWRIRRALDGNDRQFGWHLFDPEGEWAQTFELKRDAVSAIDRLVKP